MLGRRRRRWANINPTLVQCLVFAGLETVLQLFGKQMAHVHFPHIKLPYHHFQLSHLVF